MPPLSSKLLRASHSILSDHRSIATGYRTYSGQVCSSSVLLQPQEQQHSRSELSQATVYIRAVLLSHLIDAEMELPQYGAEQAALEQCVPPSRMELHIFKSHLADHGIGQMQVQAKAVKRGRARHACWTMQQVPPSVGQSGQDMYRGGVNLSPRSSTREALQPHTMMEHVGSSNSGHSNLTGKLAVLWVVLAPLPAGAGCCLLALSGTFQHDRS